MTDFELTTRSTSYLSDLRTQASTARSLQALSPSCRHFEEHPMTKITKAAALATTVAALLFSVFGEADAARHITKPRRVTEVEARLTRSFSQVDLSSAATLDARKAPRSRQLIVEATSTGKPVRLYPGPVYLTAY